MLNAMILATLLPQISYYEPPETEPMTMDLAGVQRYVANYNPVRDDKMWFVVVYGNQEWHVKTHPENITVRLDRNLVGLAIREADGMAKIEPGYRVLNAQSAVLCVPAAELEKQWRNYIDYLREGLRRGLRNLRFECVYRFDNQGVFQVRDSFWNFDRSMKIFVPLSGVTVTMDESLGEGECRVSAPEAELVSPGYSYYMTAHWRNDTATLYVNSSQAAEFWRRILSRWQHEWDSRDIPCPISPPPIPER